MHGAPSSMINVRGRLLGWSPWEEAFGGILAAAEAAGSAAKATPARNTSAISQAGSIRCA